MTVARPSSSLGRRLVCRVHRYLGLATALFLAVAGLTGSVIAFDDELDAWLNPDLFLISGEGTRLAPTELAAAAERSDPRIHVRVLPLRIEPGRSLEMEVHPRIDPATGKPFDIDYAQVFVDPYSGAPLGVRSKGFGLDRRHLIATLTAVHSSLLAGQWGRWLMGWVAVIWAVNCFFGFYLTLPSGRPFLRRWTRTWRIRTGKSAYALNFDLHRAAGLWLWGVFLLLALSSVYLNLHEAVFRPVVSVFSDLAPSLGEQVRRPLRTTSVEPELTLEDAIRRADELATQRGQTLSPSEVLWLPLYGVYGVSMAAPGEDPEAGLGPIRYFFDDQDGRFVMSYTPGEGTAGDVFLHMQFPLHSGQIAGLPTRILVSVGGIALAALSITGVVVWWRKRVANRARAAARPPRPVQPRPHPAPTLRVGEGEIPGIERTAPEQRRPPRKGD